MFVGALELFCGSFVRFVGGFVRVGERGGAGGLGYGAGSLLVLAWACNRE